VKSRLEGSASGPGDYRAGWFATSIQSAADPVLTYHGRITAPFMGSKNPTAGPWPNVAPVRDGGGHAGAGLGRHLEVPAMRTDRAGGAGRDRLAQGSRLASGTEPRDAGGCIAPAWSTSWPRRRIWAWHEYLRADDRESHPPAWKRAACRSRLPIAAVGTSGWGSRSAGTAKGGAR
jgi:hypothetical protein